MNRQKKTKETPSGGAATAEHTGEALAADMVHKLAELSEEDLECTVTVSMAGSDRYPWEIYAVNAGCTGAAAVIIWTSRKRCVLWIHGLEARLNALEARFQLHEQEMEQVV
ncbi:hypothetical protein OUZ56_012413 [Daphnia magna]|uniref:Uncharacterized protein n=1 Tax=Daphnia magna TaxID=35525 RepID=A0ABQ9Z2X3_9CRUS|nr:hypothetical protein OUZ56_012413 [Daphnia magna]